jgi:opacity protein-like surface antigen
MARLLTLVAVSAAAVALSTAARAADPARSWPPPLSKPAVPFTELLSGWYFRGDLGYRLNRVDSVVGATAEVTSYNIDNVVSAGAGIGYKYQWFRADVTVDYGGQPKFTGNAAGVPGFYSFKIINATALANIYVDLGTWSGFTPYVGAGAGASYLRVADTITHSFGLASAVPPKAKMNFSWALMGGVSMQVMSNIVVDVGYRYLKLGDVVTDVEPPLNLNATTLKNFSAQEVRFGIRFLLD